MVVSYGCIFSCFNNNKNIIIIITKIIIIIVTDTPGPSSNQRSQSPQF